MSKSGRSAARRLDDLEVVFSALAHERRRHILLTLHARGGQLGAGAIAERFACSWPTTSRHLKILVDAELIAVERRGRERIYHLQRGRLLEVAGQWLGAFARGTGGDSREP